MGVATTREPKTRFHPRRLAHSNIFVSDHDRSIPFYRDICGLTQVFDEPGIKAAFFSNGSSHHDIALMEIDGEPRVGKDGHVQIPKGRGAEPGLNHLGFEMETEKSLVEAYHRARANGVDVRRTTDHGISHSIYLFDPEGNFLEFYADAIDDWREFYAGHENQLISGQWNPDAREPEARPLYHKSYHPDPVESAAIHPRGISRATFLVSDLSEMRRFYEEVAGLDALLEGDDFVVLAGALGEASIALFQASISEEAGLHHLGFELVDTDSVDATRERLARVGVDPLAVIDSPSKQSIVVADPDGLRLEFYSPGSGSISVLNDSEYRFYLI